MTTQQVGEYIGIGCAIAAVCGIVYIIWKYRPIQHFAKLMYDFRYFVLQVVLMYSSRPSIFSIKRFHSGLILYWAIVTASLFIRRRPTLDAEGLMIIILPLLGLGGYNLYQSQQDKKMKMGIKEEPKEEDKSE